MAPMLDPVAVLEELLNSRSDQVAEVLQAACAAVRQAAPEACELIFDTYVVGSVFTFTGKMGGAFCHPVAYANHVNLGFNRGSELHDPSGLLAGTGKLIRHIRIDNPTLLQQRAVTLLIEQAVAQGVALAQRTGIAPRIVVAPHMRSAVKVAATNKAPEAKRAAAKRVAAKRAAKK